MKKITTLFTTLTLIAIVACSNKKASDENGMSNTSNTQLESEAASSMTCTINGKSFAAFEFFDQASNKLNFTLVGKSKDKLNSISLFFKRDATKAGAVFNYKFKMGEVTDNSVTLRLYENSKDEYGFKTINFETSSITITKANANRIEGAFVANGKDNNITNGKFSIATKLKW